MADEVGKALGGVLVDDDVDGHGDNLCEYCNGEIVVVSYMYL